MFIGLCVNIKFSLCVLFRINAFCKAMSGVNVNLALCSCWHHAVILTSLNGSDELDNADYMAIILLIVVTVSCQMNHKRCILKLLCMLAVLRCK